MDYDFKEVKQGLEESKKWIIEELSGIRTGRAVPNLIDKILVESYGAKMPLNQVASIAVEDARTLRVSAWDKTQIEGIQNAIHKADIGVSVSVDDAGLRVIFPEISSENRDTLARIVSERIEKARVSVRKVREGAWGDIQKLHKDNEMSEDEKFTAKDELQKLIDEASKKLDTTKQSKIKEITA